MATKQNIPTREPAQDGPQSKDAVALAQAEAATRDALVKELAAAENKAAAAQLVSDTEAEAVDTMATAARGGDTPEQRAAIDDVRARLDEARSDAHWAILQHDAATAYLQEAQEAESRANMAVAVEEYVAAHKDYNDPDSRENVLLAQLTGTMAELVPLILGRRERHNQLAQRHDSWPADVRPQVMPGKGIRYQSDTVGHWLQMNFIVPELAHAFLAGVDQGLDHVPNSNAVSVVRGRDNGEAADQLLQTFAANGQQ